MCSDRVADGMEPACVKACPTGSIRFGTKEEMLAYGETKVAKLQGRGFEEAMLYDPSGVGGLHMIYVVPRGESRGLRPAGEPGGEGQRQLRRGMKWLGRVGRSALSAGAIGGFLYWLRTGRGPCPPKVTPSPRPSGSAPSGPRPSARRRLKKAAPPGATADEEAPRARRVGRGRTAARTRHRRRRVRTGGRAMSERVFERMKSGCGAEGAVTHPERGSDERRHSAPVHTAAASGVHSGGRADAARASSGTTCSSGSCTGRWRSPSSP